MIFGIEEGCKRIKKLFFSKKISSRRDTRIFFAPSFFKALRKPHHLTETNLNFFLTAKFIMSNSSTTPPHRKRFSFSPTTSTAPSANAVLRNNKQQSTNSHPSFLSYRTPESSNKQNKACSPSRSNNTPLCDR